MEIFKIVKCIGLTNVFQSIPLWHDSLRKRIIIFSNLFFFFAETDSAMDSILKVTEVILTQEL